MKKLGFFRILQILTFSLVSSASLVAEARPLALVYKGPGACRDAHGDCADAAAAVADRAGFDVIFVGPRTVDPKLFVEAALYVQPGGNATAVSEAMLLPMKKLIRAFVHNGGGYVGFCAGGFYAMTPYNNAGTNRLGLIEGDADVEDFPYPSMVTVSWLDGMRHHVYWEGGAYFTLPRNSPVEVVSRYSATRRAAGLRALSGKGRVWVTGYHPEAPYTWRFDPILDDKDGTDADIAMAIEMMRWSARPSRR